MEAKNLNDFKTILTNLLTVILSERDGWIDYDNSMKTSSEAEREFLISLMKESCMEEIINSELIISIEPENENERENLEELEENEKS
jgi:hypothetical protein